MDIVTGIIKLLFGSKADKDRKAIEPYVNKIKEVYPSIAALSNDELRGRSQALMKQIADFIAPDEERIVTLKAQLERAETALEEKEKISKEIDEITKRIDEKIEQKLDEILPEAFAIMKDTARRFAENETVTVTANDFDRQLAASKDFVTIDGDKAVYATHWLAGGNDVKWDMVHYDVQLFGGVVLHKGKIAEMATGEGKTLVATLPVFLNALARKGVHMVTVNNYLAKRDSEWMGPMYEFHGLSVACIDDTQPNSAARRQAYMADITFGTNNEYGFDYLRDNMASSPKDLVQRKHHYAIVDEVDSVLIDDARTPLIISGPVPKGDDQLYEQYRPAIENLYNLQKNLVTGLVAEAKQLMADGKTEEGGIKLYRAHKGLPKYKPLIKFLSEQGIKAQMQKTENIYMQDNNRRMPEITDDLFFVIDEKLNSVELTDKGHEALSKYFNEDGFFVMPDIGAEVAEIEKGEGTVEEKAQKRDALINDYAVKSERVHTVHQLLKAYAMFEKDIEYVVMDNKVKIVDEQTGRILDGRRYSDGLHQAIEAKERVMVEAATQTFATITLQNYFRMYHKLAGMTGTAETEASEFWSIYKLDVVVIPTNKPILRDDREDLIYKTKREKYNAVIDEIVRLVEAGRPVLVGTTSVEISELLSRMLKLRGIKHNVLNAKQHQLEAQIVAEAGRTGQVTIATNMAGRGTDIMLGGNVTYMAKAALKKELSKELTANLAELKDAYEHEKARAKASGTELPTPPEAGIDAKLEMLMTECDGHAETEDAEILHARKRFEELCEEFTPEVKREAEVVRNAGGLFIIGTERHESRRIDNQLRGRAGRQGDPGETRFYLSLEDDLLRLFGGERITNLMDRMNLDEDTPIENKMLSKSIENAQTSVESRNFQSRKATLEYDDVMNKQREIIYGQRKQVLDGRNLKDTIFGMIRSGISNQVTLHSGEHGKLDEDGVREILGSLEGMYFPRGMVTETPAELAAMGEDELTELFFNAAVTTYERKEEAVTSPIMRELERVVLLRVVDEYWMDHIDAMQELRQGIRLRAYAQVNPIDAYKKESLEMFEEMISAIQDETVRRIFSARIKSEAEVKRERVAEGIVATTAGDGSVKKQPRKVQKIGRNDPCPCGSGKKYKQCCGR